ncbi:hypothetical protein ABWK22_02090 [Gottfriedia acidiceleris]|uniref:hypothetical protein n=1 Tax=Gottfriedia acidiceleris TaxID=371036 RepID=UPI00339738DB
MQKYRKKPVTVEAIQFKLVSEIPCKFGVAKEYNSDEIANFIENTVRVGHEPNDKPEGNVFFEIETLEGTMKASLGDYIIKGVNGEFYPCKPDIFDKTYEAIEKAGA